MTFSIIIPIYNAANYLNKMFAVIGSLEGDDWEVVCVDDGSTDGSALMLDDYARNDTRMRIIHQTNQGVSAARNRGIIEAQGEWIVFMDSDDALVPWAISTLKSVIESAPKADIVNYGYKEVADVDEKLARPQSAKIDICRYDLSNDNEARKGFYAFVGKMMAWNGCVKKSIAEKVLFKSYPNGEDTLFGMQAFCAAKNVAQVNCALYRYVQRSGSAVHSYTMRHLDSALSVIEEECKTISYSGYKDLIGARFFHDFLRCSYVGDMYNLARRLGAEGMRRYKRTAENLVVKYPRLMTKIERMVLKMFSVRVIGDVLFFLIFRMPFVFRVYAQTIPGVNMMKQLARRGR